MLREAIKEEANNLKERFAIRLDNDLCYVEVRFDQWHLHAKVIDVFSTTESLKSVSEELLQDVRHLPNDDLHDGAEGGIN